MLEYKTVYLPGVQTRISKKEWDKGSALETMSNAVAPFGSKIEEQSREGWTLHSVVRLPINIKRKKSIFEWIFGWIPLLGRLLCPRLDECRTGISENALTLVFVRDSAN